MSTRKDEYSINQVAKDYDIDKETDKVDKTYRNFMDIFVKLDNKLSIAVETRRKSDEKEVLE